MKATSPLEGLPGTHPTFWSLGSDQHAGQAMWSQLQVREVRSLCGTSEVRGFSPAVPRLALANVPESTEIKYDLQHVRPQLSTMVWGQA